MSGAFVLGGAGALLWFAVVLVLLRLSRRSPALIVVASAALVYAALLVGLSAISHRLEFWLFLLPMDS